MVEVYERKEKLWKLDEIISQVCASGENLGVTDAKTMALATLRHSWVPGDRARAETARS